MKIHRKIVFFYFCLATIWLCYYLFIVILDSRYHFLPWGELKLYKSLADKVWEGQVPYIHFLFEYPPVSIVFFGLPRILSSGMEVYRRAFEILSLFVTFVTVCSARNVLHALKVRVNIVLFLTVGFFMLIQLVLERYDTFVMFLSLGGVCFYIWGDTTKKSWPRHLAYLILILGGLTKLYPFLLIPVLMIKEIKCKEYSLLYKNLMISAVIGILFSPLLLLGREGIQFFLSYHGTRGLEVESLYASILLFFKQIHIYEGTEVVYTHASYGVAGGVADILAKLSMPLFLLLYAITCILLYRLDWRKQCEKKIVFAATLIIILFTITNKVFSAQYILWLFPFMIICASLMKQRFRSIFLGIGLLTALLSVIIYPIFWEVFVRENVLLTCILLLRNILLMILLCRLSFILRRRTLCDYGE